MLGKNLGQSSISGASLYGEYFNFSSAILLTEVSKDTSQSLELKSYRLSHNSNFLFHRLCTRHRRRFSPPSGFSDTRDDSKNYKEAKAHGAIE
jgi:hypothetical protein